MAAGCILIAQQPAKKQANLVPTAVANQQLEQANVLSLFLPFTLVE
jgi:hypothetical protein